MKIACSESVVRAAYRGPEIITVGSVTALTGAGGNKVVDAWGPDGKTATDWNKRNSAGYDVIDTAALD
ncbi:MAG: hypothetical protein ABSD27_15160 [Bryobacteraceae bacterium]|jgi:hypothetical protein